MKKSVLILVSIAAAAALLSGCTVVKPRPSTEPAVVEPPALPEMPPVIDVEPEPVVFPEPVEPVAIDRPAAQNVYVVQPGDSLSKIAVRHGIRQSEIIELNSISDPNKIRINQKLILPDHAKPSLSPVSSSKAVPSAAPAAAAANGEYIVKAGDALSKIAKAHGVKQADLMAANGIADPNKIRIGQKLKIPVPSAAPAAPAPVEAAPAKEEAAPAVAAPVLGTPDPEPATPEITIPTIGTPAPIDYQVQDGDSIESLAGIFDVSPAAIRSLNNIPAGTEPRPGQSIRIPIR